MREPRAARIRSLVTAARSSSSLPKAGEKRLSSLAGHLCLEVYLPGGVDPLPAEGLGAGLRFEAGAVEIHFED